MTKKTVDGEENESIFCSVSARVLHPPERQPATAEPHRLHPPERQIDGYNLPMLIVARGGTRGGCSSTGCLVDLNGACPRELSVVARGNGSRPC
ncbi:hypothetical protein CASFOL_014505 [Castilleja foliolosa]|uniref:Uncharacterized protein n=1 Tax=Castilleja foliolosa TaxID=1961234 RepID=A0ABD3DS70_9LAMI